MSDQCPLTRNDVEWLEKYVIRLMEAHDRRYDERFISQEQALKKAEDNNMHWKKLAEAWQEKLEQREKDFVPKTFAYLIGGAGLLVSMVALWVAVVKGF